MNQIARRNLLKGTLGASALGALGLSALTGCRTEGPAGPAQEGGSALLPEYYPYEGAVAPDFPGTEEGVMDGYLEYPISPEDATLTPPPGDGSEVSVLMLTYTAPPPGKAQNGFWQELDETLGIDLNLDIVNGSDYPEKLATTVAGGDLPDLLQIYGNVPDKPGMLGALCQDLTEFLGGDAIQDYPYLANIPGTFWEGTVYNGGIYGVPSPRSKMGRLMFVHRDLLNKAGYSSDPQSYAEFEEMCLALSDAKENRWALCAPPKTFVQAMLGLPNSWREEGGALTSKQEFEEYEQALEACRSLVEAGAVHPDSAGQANDMFKQWFNARTGLMNADQYVAWGQYQHGATQDGAEIGAMLPPAFEDGITPVTWEGSRNVSITALKSGDPDRIKMLLHVLNWLAAPVGTPEKQFLLFGVEGEHHTVENGTLELTDLGISEIGGSTGTGMNLPYIANTPGFLFEPGMPEVTQREYDFQKKYIPMAVANPVSELYSEFQSRQGSALSRELTDAEDNIIYGREPISSWADAVEKWRRDGGDQIREELEEQLAER